MSRKVIVTGAAGFVGSHLCEKLVAMGNEVVGIDNFSSGKMKNLNAVLNHKSFTILDADIILPIEQFFKDADIVFHNACSKCTVCRDDPYQDLLTNAWGTWNIIEASRINGVKKIVHASTGSTMNGKPVSFYGVSKLAGESYYRAFRDYYNIDYSILQYYHVYGTRQPSHEKGGVVPIFIKRILQDKPTVIEGDGTQIRHFTHVADVVKANLLMADLSLNEETNHKKFQCVSDVEISIYHLALLLHKIMGKKQVKLRFTEPRPGDIKTFSVSNEPLKNLGMTFKNNLEEELESIIGYYKTHD